MSSVKGFLQCNIYYELLSEAQSLTPNAWKKSGGHFYHLTKSPEWLIRACSKTYQLRLYSNIVLTDNKIVSFNWFSWSWNKSHLLNVFWERTMLLFTCTHLLFSIKSRKTFKRSNTKPFNIFPKTSLVVGHYVTINKSVHAEPRKLRNLSKTIGIKELKCPLIKWMPVNLSFIPLGSWEHSWSWVEYWK